MRAGWVIVGIIVLLVSGFVFAQAAGGNGGTNPGGGSGGTSGVIVTNDSPTALNAFTVFSISCGVAKPQLGKICAGGLCDFGDASLCSSAVTLNNQKTCSVQADLSYWGYTDLVGNCCGLGGNCGVATSTTWLAGVYPGGSVASVASSSFDSRRTHVVRISASRFVMVVDSDSGARLTTSTNSGVTWTTPIALKSLLSVSSLPVGYSLSQVEVVDPVLGAGTSATVHLSFVVRNTSTKKGSVYYSQCTNSNCSSLSAWSTPVPVLDPAVDQGPNSQGSGLDWKYSFAFPDMRVASNAVHIVFDDGETDPAKRIQGIFHRSCPSTSTCTTGTSWISPTGDPDIINSSASSNNGYPHSPSLMLLPADHVGVGWVDFVSQGGGSNQLFVSEYTPSSRSTGTWSAPLPIANPNSYATPTLTSSQGKWRILAPTSNGLSAFECAVPPCSTPATWVDVSSALSNIASISSFSNATLITSPSSFDRWSVLGDGLVSGTRRIVGLLVQSGSPSAARFLSPSSSNYSLRGLSNVQHTFDWLASSWMDYSTASGSTAYSFSTNVLDAGNSPPQLTNVVPANVNWINPSVGVTPLPAYSENISFTLQDADASNQLYVSVYLSDSPGATDYGLVDHLNVSSASSTVCVSHTFTSPQPCTLNVPVYVPNQAVVVPDGTHYLVVRVQDTSGGDVKQTYSTPINLDGAPTVLSVSQPASGSTWSSQTTNQFVFGVTSTAYLQTIKLGVMATNATTNLDLGTIDMANFTTASTGCSKGTGAVSCTIPFVYSPALPEGSYSVVMSIKEDGWVTATKTDTNVVIDYLQPHISTSSPSGTISSPPSQLMFTLTDFSGVDGSKPVKVSVNGAQLPGSAVCVPGAGNSLSCTMSLNGVSTGSLQGTSQNYVIGVTSTDLLGNDGQVTYSYTVSNGSTNPNNPGNNNPGGGGGGGGDGGPSVVPDPSDLVTVTPEGDIAVTGTGIVIPHTIVETVNSISNGIILSANNLVEVTGPSAYAIFIGLCAIAGLVSDTVFRRVFSRVVAETQRQRERVLRTALVGVFVVIPLIVGLQFSLPIGFIFAVLEIVAFVGAAYGYKILQYYQTFGFKPIEGVSSGSRSSSNMSAFIPPASPPSNSSSSENPPRPPL